MNKYKIVDNYLIFKELGTDSIGTNFRAGEIKENKAETHVLLTEVYPFFFSSSDVWNRINTLLEGIKKSNIPNLYSPEKIIKYEDKILLIYPFIMGKTFEQILKDSTKKEVPINFDLAFSIAIAIADLVDIGASIVVSGKKSFHGFLTPDNIIIDYDGKIMLKNYGIYPYLGQSKVIFSEMEKKYGTWLTPEFLRREKIIYQSDVYHLGYLIYRMLTGNYFSCSPSENFESKFSNIAFSHIIPSTEKDFLSNIIHFFKKSLNPDPMKRFLSIKEAKDYISNYFRIDELSSVTFSLAYFMNSLYLEYMEEEKKVLKEELSHTIPEAIEEVEEIKEKRDDELVESILTGLDKEKGSKKKFLLPGIIVLVLALIGGIYIVYSNLSKKASLEQIKLEQRLLEIQNKQKERENKYQEQLKKIQDKTATTEEEQKIKDEEIKKLADWKKEQERKEKIRLKEIEDAKKKKEAQDILDAEAEKERKRIEVQKEKERIAAAKEKQRLEDEKKRFEEAKKIKKGQLIALIEATIQPKLIKKKTPVFSPILKKKYRRMNFNIRTQILIDEKGDVTKVKTFGNIPDDIKALVIETLKKYKYKPAQKDNVKVKVWKAEFWNYTIPFQ